jgi:predicted dehydrogenase
LGSDVKEITFGKPTGELLELADEVAAVIRSIREGVPPPCSGHDGRRATLLCLAAERSIATGGIIQLEDFAAE